MAEYVSLCLNILKCPWNAWRNHSDYVVALNMPNHLTCSTGFWRHLGFKMCQGSEYRTAVYARVTQSSKYVELASLCLNNAWIPLNIPYYPLICLSMTEYCSVSLNMPENGWINCSDYARVLNILPHLRYLTEFPIYLRHQIC